uniref:SAP domain-containing protein n=1 Tax=Arion vulgaris TaxID=1028688 RepID=A0A0B7ATP9_9EUPU
MASEEDTYGTITLKGTPVTELRVTDIKRELEKRGLPKSGSKTQLTDRLKAQLLLEKLQQDAAQSSGDELEGKVPNRALQQDDKAGQSEFVRQYLQQQQRNLEIQMEMKKQVEEERDRISAEESSGDESKSANVIKVADPDMTSQLKKCKDDTSNAPAKEGAKMSKPARKSSRNSTKGENGQEGDQVKEITKSPIPERERPKERTRSESSSSSRSPTPDKSSRNRRGRSSRGSVKRGGGGRQGQRGKSRSSSPASSPEVITKKEQRDRKNSSSHSRSRSPQMISSELPTRRSSRRSSTTLKATPDHVQEIELPQDVSGDKSGEKIEKTDVGGTSRRKWRKKQEVTKKSTESDQSLEKPPTTVSTSPLPIINSTKDSKEPVGEFINITEKPVPKNVATVSGEPESKETESSNTGEKTAGPSFSPKDNSKTEANKVEIKPSGGIVRSSLPKSAALDRVAVAVSSTTVSDQVHEAVAEKQSTIHVPKDGVIEKVDSEKNKLVSEEKKNPAHDQQLLKNKTEKTQSGVEKETVSQIKDHQSPSRKTRRHSSYSSDSSSVGSRSRSKSPIRKKSKSKSSSSSSSDSQHSRSSSSNSSTDDSPVKESKLNSQTHTQSKDKNLRPPSHSPERIVRAEKVNTDSTKKDIAAPKKSDTQEKNDRTVVHAAIADEPKSRGQEEKRKHPDKVSSVLCIVFVLFLWSQECIIA